MNWVEMAVLFFNFITDGARHNIKYSYFLMTSILEKIN